MPTVGKGKKAEKFPYTKAGVGMAKKAAAASGKPMMMAEHPKGMPTKGMETAMSKVAGRGKASANVGRGRKK